MTSLKHMSTRQLVAAILGYTLFWWWNTSLASVLLLGVGPVILVELFKAIWAGWVPIQFGIFAVCWVLVPVVACALAVLTPLRWKPGRLVYLFYGIEVPILLLLGVRLFAIHELVAANVFALGVVGFGALGLLRTLYVDERERRAPLHHLRSSATSAYVLATLWWSMITLLYVLPLAMSAVWYTPGTVIELVRYNRASEVLILGPLLAGGMVLLGIVLMMPFLSFTAAAWAWLATVRSARSPHVALGISGATAVLVAGTFVVLDAQPQGEVFARIESADTDTERLAIDRDLEEVRRGLLSARLGADRFLEADPKGETMEDLWAPWLGDTLAVLPQNAIVSLLAPVTYRAVHPGWVRAPRGPRIPKDVEVATEHYATVFDASMKRGEREALLRSATFTWNWRDVQADLLSVGEQKVRLASQEVEVVPHGDVAAVTIHDVWRNQGFQNEEVLLAFTLPESAAVTGVWLGHTADRDEAFAYVVAPRGAAQEVYEREVRRNVDPALLEQVGPRQYRLRAFPVEARTLEDEFIPGAEGEPLHVWIELTTVVRDGQAVLPELLQARNAFWDERSLRSVPSDSWVPARLEVQGKGPQRHEVVVGGQHVTATPAVPASGRLRTVDVVIDGSASMRDQRQTLGPALATLRGAADRVRVFCVRETVLGACDDFAPATAVFWGSRSPAEHLVEWAGLGLDPAEHLVVLTDEGSYDLMGDIEKGLPSVTLPATWLVHLGGLPSAYPDWTVDLMQRTGGSAVTDVEGFLARAARPSVVDGWDFQVRPALPEESSPASPFDPLAARAAVRALSSTLGDDLTGLDALHQVAVEAHVVTPWSSMIVLVEERQRQALDNLSKDADRFEREATDQESFTAASSAVPEPATWLLLLLGGGALAGGARRRSRQVEGETQEL